ncbi:hypothetical protein JX266_005477 [Neoarthrinium moseri]|nr:hypothetical protein JX266_005477 [Neoarthrinium moseri]
MASINDLATAATIASSAVALQSSPQQQASQPAAQTSPPPQAPLTPSSAAAAVPAPAASSSTTTPGPTPAPAPAPAPQNTPPGPSAPVLAAPQISPSNLPPAQVPASKSPSVPAAAPAPVDGAVANADGAAAKSAAPPAEKKKPVRGAFIIFEGMDRAGKTTQAKLLQQRCIEEGRTVRFMRFPDRTTPIGQMIDAYLKGQTDIEDHVIHLLFSANRWEALKTIQSALASGTTIICDRYYHSGIVYSAAKQNPSLPLSWAKAPEVGLPRPDLVLFLDLEEQVARERGGWGGEIYEKGEMQRRVRELFWGLSMGDVSSNTKGKGREEKAAGENGAENGARRSSKAGSDGFKPGGDKGEFRQEEEDIQIIDADLSVEELAERVWEHVLPRLEAVEMGEVGDKVRVVR